LNRGGRLFPFPLSPSIARVSFFFFFFLFPARAMEQVHPNDNDASRSRLSFSPSALFFSSFFFFLLFSLPCRTGDRNRRDGDGEILRRNQSASSFFSFCEPIRRIRRTAHGSFPPFFFFFSLCAGETALLFFPPLAQRAHCLFFLFFPLSSAREYDVKKAGFPSFCNTVDDTALSFLLPSLSAACVIVDEDFGFSPFFFLFLFLISARSPLFPFFFFLFHPSGNKVTKELEKDRDPFFLSLLRKVARRFSFPFFFFLLSFPSQQQADEARESRKRSAFAFPTPFFPPPPQLFFSRPSLSFFFPFFFLTPPLITKEGATNRP